MSPRRLLLMTADGPPDWATTMFFGLATRDDSVIGPWTGHLTKASWVTEGSALPLTAALGRAQRAGMSSVLESTRTLLQARGVAFREVHHRATFTSEESARARGEELRIGGKALLL